MEDLTITSLKETSILDNQTPTTWHKRECIERGDGFAVIDGKIEHPIRVRWIMGRSKNTQNVYCTVSISKGPSSTHGHGVAKGYGYDKKSAALDSALRSASVELSRSINGTGESRQAIKAIVKHLYPTATDIVTVIG